MFGAEFVTMKSGIETCRGLCYKLRMMGVTMGAPSYVYGYNMSVLHNAHCPDSFLKKRSNSMFYHTVRDSAAMGESLIGHVPSIDNPDEIFTKVVPGGQKRYHYLILLLLHDLCDLIACLIFLLTE
jgi:hypothetical protein